MSALALFAALALPHSASAPPQDPGKVWFLKDARVVIRPGQVLDKASILIQDGKIAGVGTNLTAPSGAEVLDCTGLTAYPGLIHPFYRVSVSGLTTAPAGGGGPGGGGGGRPQQTAAEQLAAQRRRDADPFGREGNLLTKTRTKDMKQADVSAFKSFAEKGYGLVQMSASGGLVGPAGAVYSTAGKDLDAAGVVSSPDFVPISPTSRGFGGYPSSTMGAVAFVRQALYDAQRYGRLQTKPADPSLDVLQQVTSGQSRAVFDDLTEVSYFMASNISKEFGLKPVFGFREDAGAVADLLKGNGTSVLLKGNIPSKPTIGANLDNVSLAGVRSYFGELQAGADLEKAGVSFSYAPSSASDPFEGIRSYVRAGLNRDAALASMTTRPAELLGIADKAGTLEQGKMGNVLLTQGDVLDSSSQIMAVYVQGKRIDIKMPERKKAEDLKADAPLALMPANHTIFPRPAESAPAFRLYKNATVWTMGPQGVIKGGDILIRDGKIVQVGRGIKAPDGCQVIDASGKHISPGIWDCHSHTGIFGGVNEGSNMITIECRIGDVTNHHAINIYQQLSGGTVGANQLHGSANAIGGQSWTVKWRWGQRPTEFHVAGAPEGVKFALGQNPIREDPTGGNFGSPPPPIGETLLTWRPRTRMGVEEAIRRALQLGKEYNESWEDFRSGKTKVEPRRDLQLEGLGEIVTQKRLVHSHGYREDELLMLVRVVPEYGGKIATLQHVLEGYKIADEMAQQGIGGSTFADWWGYKLEAYDAIPYNAALMDERGVSVSINSDSDNHARRLNSEAAKSMRYGGVSAEKALSFVTIEPAKQLGIAKQTGSLEVGKDADIAIWTNDPTSIYAICVETYVDGVKRFDRADDMKQRSEREAELLAAKKILAGGGTTASTDTGAFDSGNGAARPGPSANEPKGKSTASFGIGPVRSEPGTMRYQRPALLISGATVHPMDGVPFVGDVLIGANGKILAAGKGLNGNGAQNVNGRGKHVYPGLIDPATWIGLNEIGQVPASDDSAERGNFHPDYRVERTINPEWETMAVARQQGILTVLVKPSGGGLAGQAALINTEGYTWEDLTVQGGVAMTYAGGGGGFANGSDGRGHQHDDEQDGDDDMTAGQGRGGQQPVSQSYTALTDQLAKAREYTMARKTATPEKPVARDQRQEALALVADGRMPVLLSVNSATEIKNAVAWAEQERIKIVLYGCAGAGEIADWLAEKQVPIILVGVYRMPTADQAVDYYYSLPAKLAKAGVKFCLSMNDDKDVRQVRDQAGWAAAYGVEREEAARLVTLRAAEVLGIADRLGAIKPGMDGTVIMTDGEIVETKTKVLRAWIQGREVDLTNRQTRLYDKYRKRPRQVATVK